MQTVDVNEGVFSIHQSNVLYYLYLLGFLFCIVADLSLQAYRRPVFRDFETILEFLSGILELIKTIAFCCIVLSIANAMLWFDFIIQSRRVDDSSNTGNGVKHLLMLKQC